jgi:hypothetical protein
LSNFALGIKDTAEQGLEVMDGIPLEIATGGGLGSPPSDRRRAAPQLSRWIGGVRNFHFAPLPVVRQELTTTPKTAVR